MRGKLQEDLQSSGCSVLKWTINNEMLGKGLKSRRPKKTTLLLKWHRDAGLKFVRQHKEKKNSFYEDETKIELFGHNYRNLVWRKDGKVQIVKIGGGSIMIWGCFTAKGEGKISLINDKINAQKYKQILLRILSYLLITFSNRIMIPSIQLNLRRNGCLKIM